VQAPLIHTPTAIFLHLLPGSGGGPGERQAAHGAALRSTLGALVLKAPAAREVRGMFGAMVAEQQRSEELGAAAAAVTADDDDDEAAARPPATGLVSRSLDSQDCSSGSGSSSSSGGGSSTLSSGYRSALSEPLGEEPPGEGWPAEPPAGHAATSGGQGRGASPGLGERSAAGAELRPGSPAACRAFWRHYAPFVRGWSLLLRPPGAGAAAAGTLLSEVVLPEATLLLAFLLQRGMRACLSAALLALEAHGVALEGAGGGALGAEAALREMLEGYGGGGK
jgi:hypothetical protein